MFVYFLGINYVVIKHLKPKNPFIDDQQNPKWANVAVAFNFYERMATLYFLVPHFGKMIHLTKHDLASVTKKNNLQLPWHVYIIRMVINAFLVAKMTNVANIAMYNHQ